MTTQDSGSRRTVLVVDDTPDNLTVLSDLLKDEYKVKLANGGAKALKIAATAPPPDLILLDWGLPGMSGIELARVVRHAAVTPDERFTNPAVPMIMLTARQSARDVTTARNAGIDEFVIKPFSTVSILKAICSCVARRRPFIVSAGYVGPCRRRRVDAAYDGPERRAGAIKSDAA